MASIAVLPTLKRTITDIMEDELYHVPNSPIYLNSGLSNSQDNFATVLNNSSAAPGSFQNSSVANGIATGAMNATGSLNGSDPTRTNSRNITTSSSSSSSTFGFNTSQSSLMTNAQFDTLMEQHRTLPQSFNNTNMNNMNFNNHGSSITIDPSQMEMFGPNPSNDFASNVSPFADYANPDSQNSIYNNSNVNNNNIHNNNNNSSFYNSNFNHQNNFNNNNANVSALFNNIFNPTSRRRRLTTLDMPTDEKPLKDEDYYLFNTDIQPSLVSQDENVNEDYICLNSPLFVPHPPTISEDIRIPKYENDYLSMSAIVDFEEDMEDDTSDDDDNYFHDDFEEMLENNDEYWNNNMQINNNINNLNINNNNNNNHNVNINNNGNNDNNGNVDNVNLDESVAPISVMMKNINQFADSQMTISMNSSHEHEYPTDNEEESDMLFDDSRSNNVEISSRASDGSLTSLNSTPTLSTFETSPVLSSSSDSEVHDEEKYVYHDGEHHHQTAAEISATNPNHQCDLINPSTGKPCSKQFSRPYDLIRHQETIHAAKKKIFRCVICEGRYNGGLGNGKLKTFSRGDALSRHIKVKHGLVGKEALDLINNAKANVEFVSV